MISEAYQCITTLQLGRN